MIEKLLGFIFGVLGPGLVLGLAIGVVGAETYERRPANTPSWAHVDVLFLHWRLPDGLEAAGDAKAVTWRKAFATEQASFHVVLGALQDQNAAVGRWSALSRRAIASNESAVARYAAATRSAQARATAIAVALPPPAAAPVCARYEAVHAALQEQLP